MPMDETMLAADTGMQPMGVAGSQCGNASRQQQGVHVIVKLCCESQSWVRY
jgi:hypothetical protein